MNKPELSIIVPHHNEPMDFMVETIDSIKSSITTQDYEVIICDDHSNIPFEYKDDKVRVFRQKEHRGVGQAFDMGVANARSDNLILQGSDIRYVKNNWDIIMLEEMEQHPKATTCSACIGLNKVSEDGMNFEKRRNRSRRFGATILLFHDHKSHPKKPKNFKSLVECQWLPSRPKYTDRSYPIPAILGACYSVKKQWYEYIGGFEFHRSWGSLESYYSLKNWFFGGECRVAPHCEVGHIFKASGTHNTPLHHLTYNKLLAATLLFKDHDTKRMINFLGRNPQVDRAKQMFDEHKGAILTKKEEYRKKMVMSAKEYCDKFNIDFRDS